MVSPRSGMPRTYDQNIDSITNMVRATNPELFEGFRRLQGKVIDIGSQQEPAAQLAPAILVFMVADSLVSVVGEGVWSLPYRLFANYLIAERIFKFSKVDVVGGLRIENVEFLKTQLGLLIEKKSNTSSFLNALKHHFGEVDKAAVDAANAHLTPEERKLRRKRRDGRFEGR